MNPIPNDNDNDGRVIKKKPIGTYMVFVCFLFHFFFYCDETVRFFVIRFNVKKAIRMSTRFGQKDIATGDRWKISISDLNGV